MGCWRFAHKARSILPQIGEHSLREIITAVRTPELEVAAKSILHFALNTHQNRFQYDFNSHLGRMITDVAEGRYL